MALRIGIDVGGTFTDLLLYDDVAEGVWIAKTPTTPKDQSEGVIKGVSEVTQSAGVEPGGLDLVLHGTTVATNAVLEKRGARVGVIVTAGFRHIFHLAEAWTPGPLFGFMRYEKPEPLAQFERVAEVDERVDATGNVIKPLNRQDARRSIESLLGAGAEAITVCLINSYVNPTHEQMLGELIEELAPDMPVSLSFEVMSEFREYDRAVTTVMNAYVAEKMNRYLLGLSDKLKQIEVASPVHVIRSDGGLMRLDTARRLPVHTVLSGPAGGVNGAAYVSRLAGHDDLITLDMGGTSTDVAVCQGGEPTITRETRVGAFPVSAPSVDVESIGAGGGSIASVAEVTGALRVGPESAGADPGPACYGNGGTRATVTDANLVVGHLPPRLLGGAVELDVEAAHRVVGELAEKLGMDVVETAHGILKIVNENMLGALRLVTVQKGRTPADFALVAFGGAGPLHANALAATLGCFPIVVPYQTGVLSALGFVASDVRNEFSQTYIQPVEDIDESDVRLRLDELTDRATGFLVDEGVPETDREINFVIDMRYLRQGFEIPIEVEDAQTLDLSELASSFTAAHERLYGYGLESGVEIVNLRAIATGRMPQLTLPETEPAAADPSPAQTGSHRVWGEAGDEFEVPTFNRELLKAGMRISGYAIIEQYDSTTVVLPGHTAEVDSRLNLIIRAEGGKA